MKEVKYTQSFSAIIHKDGGGAKLIVRSPKYYHSQLAKFRDKEEVSLLVTNQRPKRSEQQNRYWWVYMTLIGEETGHAPEEIHEWAKGKFLTKGIVTIFGQLTRIKGSTTELSKSEFGELIMRVEAETGIASPPVENYDLQINSDSVDDELSTESDLTTNRSVIK